ncbi:MAG: histidine kinase [Aurantibacter sp.]
MRNLFIICLLILTSASYSQSAQYNQQQVDSFAIKPLNKENLQKFKNILESNEGLFGWSKYYAFLGYYNMVKANNDSAMYFARKSIQHYENMWEKHPNEEKSLVQALFTLGYIERANENYEASTRHLLKALTISNKYEVSLKSYILTYAANNYLSLGNNSKALEYFHKSLRDSLFISSPQAEITTLTRIGVLYTAGYLDQIDSAMYYFKTALYRSRSSEYKNNLPFIYGNIADLFRGKNNDSTLYYYRHSKKAFETFVHVKNESPDNTDFYQVVNNSYVEIFANNIDKAVSDLQMVIDSLGPKVADKNDRDVLVTAYENLILGYEKKNDLKRAILALKEKGIFENEFHQKLLAQELEKLEIDFETKNKEQEIVKLKEEAQKTETILLQQRIISYSAISLGVLLLAIGGLFYKQNSLNEKFRRVSLEQRLLRSQMNPHFLFNALNTASLLVDKKSVDAKTYILKLAKLLRLTLENSREDFVLLEDELSALESYLELQSNFSKNFDYELTLAGDIEPHHMQIPPMLIQPFIENAIVHGIAKIEEKGQIKIEIKKNGKNLLLCRIVDNGVGIHSKDKKSAIGHKSISLSIVKERLDVYHKKSDQKPFLEIDNASENEKLSPGTKVTFTIPCHMM